MSGCPFHAKKLEEAKKAEEAKAKEQPKQCPFSGKAAEAEPEKKKCPFSGGQQPQEHFASAKTDEQVKEETAAAYRLGRGF